MTRLAGGGVGKVWKVLVPKTLLHSLVGMFTLMPPPTGFLQFLPSYFSIPSK